MQTCIWPSWCHWHSLSLTSVKSTLVLPFWLTRIVLDKGLLNRCVCVYRLIYRHPEQHNWKRTFLAVDTACMFPAQWGVKTRPAAGRGFGATSCRHPHRHNYTITTNVITYINRPSFRTRSSAIAEGPRDALCQLKSCQLPRNSAEITYTTSPDQIDGMKLEI